MQKLNEFRLHKRIIVGNIHADNPGLLQMGFEASRQPGSMALVHDKNDVGPLEQFRGAGGLRVMVEAS